MAVYEGIISADLDIVLREGDYHQFLLTFLDAGVAYDLTAFSGTLTLRMRKTKGTGDVLETLTEGSGLTVANTNELTIVFSETESDHNGLFQYDIQGTDIEGLKTVAEGKLKFTNNV